MSTKEKFRNTFSKMHAGPDTVEQVLKKAEQREQNTKTSVRPIRSHSHKKKKLPAAAAVLIAAALGSTAVFAAVHSNFFDNAFGTGISNKVTYLYGDDGEAVADGEPATVSYTVNTASGPVSATETFPAYKRVAVDPELAEKLIGGSVETLDQSVTVGKWTYAVGDYVFDENGNGIVAVTISNPDGISAWKETKEKGADPYTSCVFLDADGNVLSDHGENIVENSWTDTSVDVVYYIAGSKTGFAKQTLSMHVYADDPDDPTLSDPEAAYNPEEASLSIPVTKLASAKEYTGENFTVSISPLGCMITYTGDRLDNLSEYLEEEFVIHYEDGTEYTVVSDSSNEANENGGAMDDNGHTWIAFNRLADTTQISGITFSAEVVEKDDTQTEVSTTLK